MTNLILTSCILNKVTIFTGNFIFQRHLESNEVRFFLVQTRMRVSVPLKTPKARVGRIKSSVEGRFRLPPYCQERKGRPNCAERKKGVVRANAFRRELPHLVVVVVG